MRTDPDNLVRNARGEAISCAALTTVPAVELCTLAPAAYPRAVKYIVFGDTCRIWVVTSVPDRAAQWWTTSDVAAYLGVGVATVSTYRRRGQMPAPDQTVGRTHMWRPARIVAWHDARPRPGVGGRRPSKTVGQGEAG